MVNQKKLAIVFIILSVVAAGYFAYTNFSGNSKICIEDKACFNIEIADSSEERILGLSNRSFLGEDSGMLFVFESEVAPEFWMKDMRFPLDIIWINKENKIVGIEENIWPCANVSSCTLYHPKQPIEYVLEINANQSSIYNFVEGDLVRLAMN